MQTDFPAFTEYFNRGVSLLHGFAAGECNSSGFSVKRPVFQNLGNYFGRIHGENRVFQSSRRTYRRASAAVYAFASVKQMPCLRKGVGATQRTTLAADAGILCKENPVACEPRFRIVAPFTRQRAAVHKNHGANTRSIMSAKMLNLRYIHFHGLHLFQ